METYVKHNYWEGSTKIINIHTASKICRSRHNLSQWLYYNRGNNPKLYLLAIRVLSNLLSELNKYSFYSKNRYFFPKKFFPDLQLMLVEQLLFSKTFLPFEVLFQSMSLELSRFLLQVILGQWTSSLHSCTKHSSQCSLLSSQVIVLLLGFAESSISYARFLFVKL